MSEFEEGNKAVGVDLRSNRTDEGGCPCINF
jgi:hypothetical protein